MGTFINTPEALDAYTLFAPMGSDSTYLINNCGERIHSWGSGTRPALAVYLLDDGSLLRTKNMANGDFSSGGSGGGFEILDWNSNVIWEYTISSTTECQHHDIEMLPNGNILAIVWDYKSDTAAIANGRNAVGSELWSEKIVEIEPDYVNGGGNVVWEWSAWDHLIQDHDNGLANYGVVGDHPELIDINFYLNAGTNSDWLHINGVDYNANLDQIVLSNHNFSELWIIDHSTTTAEAASHTGGNSGKGGDLLYRWGNPQTYHQGTVNDQQYFKQHDAYWIEDGYVDEGQLMIFNNQVGTAPMHSEINIIDPPVDINGDYSYTSGAYAPLSYSWSYAAPVQTDFFSSNISGARRLSNGNTLICEGQSGTLFEVDYNGNVVWEYVNPTNAGGPLTQGDQPSSNKVFRCQKYEASHPGLQGKNLTPKGRLELGLEYSCELHPTGVGMENSGEIMVYPNPTNSIVHLNKNSFQVSVLSLEGELVMVKSLTSQIDLSELSKGIYFLRIEEERGSTQNIRVIKK